MTILLAFPSSAMSFFLIFVLLELDSDLSTFSISSSSHNYLIPAGRLRGLAFFTTKRHHSR